jgi:mono/diheme cytochrome c family protein
MLRTNRIAFPWLVLLLGALTVWALTGCGGQGGGASATNTPAAAVPTMPPARFTAVAQQSALTATVALTTVADVVTGTAEVTQTTAAGPAAADLERGARSYERNQCASCHGERGEGVAGKGGAIAGTTLSEREFENVLRTGGGLGNTHIFGPSAVSPAGMGALYAYVQSLQ